MIQNIFCIREHVHKRVCNAEYIPGGVFLVQLMHLAINPRLNLREIPTSERLLDYTFDYTLDYTLDHKTMSLTIS
jgi:hypothetical protein